MQAFIFPSILLIGAYLLGSINCAILICRVLRLGDPRESGSCNPGTTNMLRLAGKWPALLTLLGDALKGFLPAFICQVMTSDAALSAWVLLAAVLGHAFPLFFRFQGGKGVATFLGGVFGLAWPLGGLALLTWLVIALVFRYSSLAALITAVCLPFYGVGLLGITVCLPLAVLSILVISLHHENICRLWTGKEAKLGQK